MTSLSTWLRAAIGSSRRGGLTPAPVRAGGPRTRKPGLPGHATPRPGSPLPLPWNSSPASPDELRAVSRRGSRGQSVPSLPSADGARYSPGRANLDAARGDGHFIRGHWALAPECDIRLIVDDDLVIDIAVHRAPD